MNPLLAYGIATGASGLANAIFGKDEYSLSPEEKRYLDYIKKQLARPESELGLTAEEKLGMKTQLSEGLGQGASQATSSLKRRGLLGSGQTGAMYADVGGQYGRGVNDINVASAQIARQQKNRLLDSWGNIAGREQRETTDFSPYFTDIAESLVGMPDNSQTPGYNYNYGKTPNALLRYKKRPLLNGLSMVR